MSSEESTPVPTPLPPSARTRHHARGLPYLLTVTDVSLMLCVTNRRILQLVNAGCFPGAYLEDRWVRPTGQRNAPPWRRRAWKIPSDGVRAYLEAKRKKHAGGF